MSNLPREVPVTVCMPVYNGARYVRDAIRSVLNQTVIPQEVIVSDSGSSDGTIDVIRDEAEGSGVNLTILAATTAGMVANWNSTVRAASGKYIKFLFQDDLLHPNCLEEMVSVAESDERIGFVFSPRELLIEPSAEGDAITKWLLRYQNLSAAFGELKSNQPGAALLRSRRLLDQPLNKIGEPTAVLVRTRLFGEVGLFNERMRQLVDMEMWIRLMATSHVGYVSKPLMSVRIHPGRASKRHFRQEVDSFERDSLRDTLRTPAIYPLLHRRVRCALRQSDRRRRWLFPTRTARFIRRVIPATFSYIHRYAAALNQLRRVRTVAQNATFDEAFSFAEMEFGIGAKREEIARLFELVRAARPRVVLEIGPGAGGTFFLWSRAADPDAHLFAVDTQPVGYFGDWSPFPLILRGFAAGSQRVTLLMHSDSHCETTWERIVQLLDGRPVDFLFIDGHRSCDEVWQDFNMYSSLVAPGGLIAFNDRSQRPAEWLSAVYHSRVNEPLQPTKGAARFWRKFAFEHETRERGVNNDPEFGIGLYRVPFESRFSPRVSTPTGASDPLIPHSLHSVGALGSADYVAVSEEFFRYFVGLCELKPDDRVLEVGSGTGRMARPLTRYLQGGDYEGIDIVAPSVEWCQRSYTPRYPNFHFHFADIYNEAYTPNGRYMAREYRFPFETSSFDFVFLTSVFTHMLPQDMEHYLSEIVRVLKPRKRCLITYFLLNPASRESIDEGLSHYSFKYELPGCRVEVLDTPEAVVAYDESTVRALYAEYDLKIIEPVFYGMWCKRQDGLSWQDMIIATKPADSL